MEVVEVGQPPTNDVGIQQPPPSLPSTFLIFPAKNPLSSSNTLTSRTRAAGTTKEMDVIHKLVQRLNVVGNPTTISEGADGSSSREGGAAEATTEMSVVPPPPPLRLINPTNKNHTKQNPPPPKDNRIPSNPSPNPPPPPLKGHLRQSCARKNPPNPNLRTPLGHTDRVECASTPADAAVQPRRRYCPCDRYTRAIAGPGEDGGRGGAPRTGRGGGEAGSAGGCRVREVCAREEG